MSTEIEINSPKRLRHLKLVGIVVLLAAAGIVTTGIFTRVHAKQEMTTWSAAQAIPTVVAYTPSHQGADAVAGAAGSSVRLRQRADLCARAGLSACVVRGYRHACESGPTARPDRHARPRPAIAAGARPICKMRRLTKSSRRPPRKRWTADAQAGLGLAAGHR